MAAFNENGWMPGGHAVRMAVDMGINRSFVALLRSGMGQGKSVDELEEERHLVVQSRVWFCVRPPLPLRSSSMPRGDVKVR